MKIARFFLVAACCAAVVACNDDKVDQYSVTVNAGENGKAAATPAKAEEGTTVTLTATPDEGYEFARWTVENGGMTLSSETAATATFTMSAQDVTVSAAFAPAGTDPDYSVFVTVDVDGATVTATPEKAKKGEEVTISFTTADDEIEFLGWIVVKGDVDLEDQTAETTTFVMPAEDVVIKAQTSADPETYAVTLTIESEEDAVVVADPAQAKEGTTVMITFDAVGEGVSFEHWNVIEGDVDLEDETAAETTFVMPAGDVEIEAVYGKVSTGGPVEG